MFQKKIYMYVQLIFITGVMQICTIVQTVPLFIPGEYILPNVKFFVISRGMNFLMQGRFSTA